MHRRLLLLSLLPLAVIGLAGGVIASRDSDRDAVDAATRPVKPHVRVRPSRLHLTARAAGSLPAAVQDPAVAAVAGRVLAAGGLTAADTSSDRVVSLSGRSGRQLGRLPGVQHDAPAVSLGRAVYVFGGGDGLRQLDHILRVDPRTGAVRRVGRLPAASSDATAAAIGRTAYIVGGYTGARWLSTIVAWRPGERASVVGHLRVPLRYAAATAVGDKLLIAGGSTPAGTASRSVWTFDPATKRVRLVAALPAPTTHAAAATLHGIALVIGGRGAAPGTPTARIVAIDAASGRTWSGGRLPQPLSDTGAVTIANRIVVVGGRAPQGAVSTVAQLAPAAARTQEKTRAVRRKPSAVVSNVYAHALQGMLAPVVRTAPARVYVPNSESDSVDVIDPRTFRVVDHFAVGALPQHVVPAYDLRTLYVNNDVGNSLTPIDPPTGRPGKPIHVDDPYNLYFTPNGRYAIVVAERLHRLDFRDARTFRLHRSLNVPCAGVNHMDFSADGTYAIVSCEFSGQLLKLDVRRERVIGTLTLRGHAVPQDVRVSPKGGLFYVADLAASGVWKVNGRRFRVVGFDRTGAGAHGLVVSRNAKLLYVANRNAGTISVISFKTTRVVRVWHLPGGGSPDMGGVSPNGRVLWLSGRYNAVVYAIDTRNGRLLARIAVGASPHGVLVWPQPGRYSLGHVGILR
jgi:YVTN family beta-propeller protein